MKITCGEMAIVPAADGYNLPTRKERLTNWPAYERLNERGRIGAAVWWVADVECGSIHAMLQSPLLI